MNQSPHIAVLLSSFNGAAYIEEQIHSILNQRGVSVSLTVRDDGSTDATPAILQRLASQHPALTIALAHNIGVIQSFFALMRGAHDVVEANADSAAQYFSLSDQDDLWYPDKLLRAVMALQKNDASEILMYCSGVENVDAQLAHLSNSRVKSLEKIGYHNALVENCATGCTIVLNRTALTKLTARLPHHCVMHDWWIYLVVAALGTVIYDAAPSMKYRQHSQNVIGVAPSLASKYKRRLRRLLADSPTAKTSIQLREFEQIYGADLNQQRKKLLKRFAAYKTNFLVRVGLVGSAQFCRQSRLDDLLIRCSILIGKF